jgi:hypothetical protein
MRRIPLGWFFNEPKGMSDACMCTGISHKADGPSSQGVKQWNISTGGVLVSNARLALATSHSLGLLASHRLGLIGWNKIWRLASSAPSILAPPVLHSSAWRERLGGNHVQDRGCVTSQNPLFTSHNHTHTLHLFQWLYFHGPSFRHGGSFPLTQFTPSSFQC